MSKGGKAQTVNTSGTHSGASRQDVSNAQTDILRQLGLTSQIGTQAQSGSNTQVGAQNQHATQNQVGTQGLDAASQAYVNQQRALAQAQVAGLMNSGPLFTGALTQSPAEMAAGFMNPYTQNVVDATRGEFDHLRNQASMNANQQATLAGAFGGSRHGVMEGTRLGELDRAQAGTIANLLNSGYQNALGQGVDFAQYQQGLQQQQMLEPLFRAQQGINLLNLGMGPTGMVNTSTGSNVSSGTNMMQGTNRMTGSNTMSGMNSQNSLNQSNGRSTITGMDSSRTTGTQQIPQQRGSALGGAAGGALTGASLGSIIPVLGTGIGAAIGGGLGLLGWL